MDGADDRGPVWTPSLIEVILRESQKYGDEEVRSYLKTLGEESPGDVVAGEAPVPLLRILAHAAFLRNLASVAPNSANKNAIRNQLMAELAQNIANSQLVMSCGLWQIPSWSAGARVRNDGKIAWMRAESAILQSVQGGASRGTRLC
jgi:hypothetical protein